MKCNNKAVVPAFLKGCRVESLELYISSAYPRLTFIASLLFSIIFRSDAEFICSFEKCSANLGRDRATRGRGAGGGGGGAADGRGGVPAPGRAGAGAAPTPAAAPEPAPAPPNTSLHCKLVSRRSINYV